MIIGLVGRAGSGKTTIATMLQSNYGFVRVGFADAIKQTLFYLGLFSKEELWGKKTAKSRQALQEFGEWVRKYDYMHWTDKCYTKILGYRQEGHLDIVIDDVRRVDEAEMIKRLGGKLVRIYRDEIDCITDYTHISETEMEELIPTWNIRNNGTIAILRMQVVDMMKNFIGKEV
jgi:broad-specificity NMP kinase